MSIAAGVLVVWLVLLACLLVVRPRAGALTESVRLLPDLLRLVARLARPGRGDPTDDVVSHSLWTAALVAYVAFVSFHAVYIHSNTRWRFPVLRRVIATPEYHHWHHTSDEEGLDKNFAAFLPLWDWLFGTLHLPAHWPWQIGWKTLWDNIIGRSPAIPRAG